MFVRMLKLPPDVRERYDLSSLQSAVHAAAPCPVETKRQMIEWWGPIISEYYSATEGMGATFITSEEWLAHPGSVGKSILGEPKIIDDDGNEVPVGQPGVVWFLSGNEFEYHNDPAKTAENRHTDGLATVGDVGYLDEEGYLYLTDRKTFMIVSGGVNIYPQEAENLLVTHPKVLDAARREQVSPLVLGALTTREQDEHRQVEQFGEAGFVARQDDLLEDDEAGIVGHRPSTRPQDRDRLVVAPVVQDLREDVHVAAGGDFGEEVAADHLTAVVETQLRELPRRFLD